MDDVFGDVTTVRSKSVTPGDEGGVVQTLGEGNLQAASATPNEYHEVTQVRVV